MPDVLQSIRLSDRSEWKGLVESYVHYNNQRRIFLRSDWDKLEIVRQALYDGDAWPLALELLPRLPEERLRSIFPDLVRLSMAGDSVEYWIHNIIVGYLNREWVIQHIHALAMPILEQTMEYYETSSLIGLYDRLSPALVKELATWAASSPHPSIKEYGQDWLSQISS